MIYYFIANIDIRDEHDYQKYIDKAEDIFKKYKGKYLAVDNSSIRIRRRMELYSMRVDKV